MKLLLKMIYSAEAAKSALKLCHKKKLMIVHKKYGMALDEEIIDAGGVRLNLGKYGTSFTLNVGKSFFSSWGLTKLVRRTANIYSDVGSLTHWDTFNPDLSENNYEGLAGLTFFFYEYNPYKNERNSWLTPQVELTKKIETLGGKTTAILDDADVLITQGWYHDPNLTLRDDVIAIHQEQFLKILPKEAKRTHKPSPRLTGESAHAWSLLSSKDFNTIQKGIDFAANNSQIIDILLKDCSLTKDGSIHRNKRFSGTGPALSYLDIALYGLLSTAPDNTQSAALRNSIKSISLCSSALPRLAGFDSLEELRIVFLRGARIAHKNLNSFRPLPKLKILEISTDSYGPDILDSLEGLNAPDIHILNISCVGLKNIDALCKCNKLRIVNLSNNDQLDNIKPLFASKESIEELNLSYCSKISSLDPLSGANFINKISLNGCREIKSLQALSACKNLQNIEMENVSLPSIEGIECLQLTNVEIDIRLKLSKPTMIKDLLNPQNDSYNSNIEISDITVYSID